MSTATTPTPARTPRELSEAQGDRKGEETSADARKHVVHEGVWATGSESAHTVPLQIRRTWRLAKRRVPSTPANRIGLVGV